MQPAQELELISHGIGFWRAYDPKVKAELFSTALQTPAGTYLIDPIPLASDALSSLRQYGSVAGIFVTNENHSRAAAKFAETFATSIYVHGTLSGNPALPKVITIEDAEMFSEGLTAINIAGGPNGETALHCDAFGGTVVLGDALINFEPYGFALLPDKYCLDPSLMRQSLQKLLNYSFERMFFAHGTPILRDARGRLKQLLGKIR